MKIHFYSISKNALAGLSEQLHDLMIDAWGDESVVIVAPQVPKEQFDVLNSAFKELADAESLDMLVRFQAEDGVQDSWDLGWNDGSRVIFDIYSMAYFDANEYLDAEFDPLMKVAYL